MQTVTPFLWIQHPVDEAANFYAGLFDDGQIVSGPNVGDDMSSATVRMSGQTIHLFNAGTQRALTEAFSLMVTCSTQAEIDRLWDALCDGGTPSMCGWVTDRFGVTWQVVPDSLQEWLSDPARGGEVAKVMLQMQKLEIADLRAALSG
ncbi:MAG: VOC family protein [Actinobacteria bacterium]|nr:VOC family protein [Actinomycetota bacterium]MCB8997271.1 VOC family protein [Actinomycetota bacterium]MCB9423581.1 VOC family protein [Actinomycetota bacterium]HRY10523.1 VOC family protein [Candidatus Nanopelagicales bacterium]